MCLVEVEKMPKLTPACATIATEGMVVRTNSERVREAVRGVLELMLINHPVDCPVCDQAGECRLQDYYMVYGLHESHIPLDMKVRKRKVVDLGPMVVLDEERCILCSRCVRFCEEVTKTGELQFFGRGDHVRIGTFEDRPLENPYSGNVVDICPVGALTSRDFRFKCRVWFLHSADSVCAGCSTGCNVRIDYSKGKIFRLVPRRNVEVNKSWICDEGRLSFHQLERGERLTRPLAKAENGALVETTWQEAIPKIAARLREIKSNFGPDSILGFASASATNEALFLLKRYLRDHIGSQRLEFRFDSEDEKLFEPEDQLLRRADKRPNSMGAIKLGYASADLGNIEGAIEASRRGQIRAAIILYFKPLVLRPGCEREESLLGELIRALEFSVALTSHRSPWHAEANFVLPVAAWSEEDGTFTNYQGRVQFLGRAIDPGPEVLPAWRALAMLTGEDKWASAEEVFASLAENEPAYRGIAFEQTRLPGTLISER
jgi:NADH-quinone oxidoreductase subunit G